ncbi:MAG: quinone-dependent dihydroorotate dehydrogenase [Pseudomonadota bacterium]
MLRSLASLAQPFLLRLDAERAHELAIEALKTGLHPRPGTITGPALQVSLWDLDFPNPLGMAAGFDKSAEVPDALLSTGFGFVEVGTVTPKPQDGNPRPRVFRAPQDNAVINRLGFNNQGHAAVRARLMRRRQTGIVGVNVGANKTSTDKAADYVAGIETFSDLASFFTINISSPNTPGLRDLQHAEQLDDLLVRCVAARDAQQDKGLRRVPLFLKIAPDLEDTDLDDIAQAVTGRSLDGVIVSNTTLSRNGITDPAIAAQAGGLSGKPLFHRATVMLARMRQRLPADMPMIGIGGVESADTAFEKIRAGATLLELYTGLIYGGVDLVETVLTGLTQRLEREGFASVTDAVGTGMDDWAARNLSP